MARWIAVALLAIGGVAVVVWLTRQTAGTFEDENPGLTALAAAIRAVQASPRDAQAWAALGDAQAANDDPIAAEQSYQTAISLSGRTPDLLARMGFLLYARGEDAWALLLLSEAKHQGANLPMLDFTLGELLEKARSATVASLGPRPATSSSVPRPARPAPAAQVQAVLDRPPEGTDAGALEATGSERGSRVCELPLDSSGSASRHSFVPVLVNGQSLRLVFDTGASMTTLTRDALIRLGIPYDEANEIRAMTALGPARFPTAQLADLSVGGRSTGPLRVAALCPTCTGPDDGLLGLDVQARLGLVLDLPANRLRFTDCR